MGGEYLPEYLPGEVEIARIVFASVTRDVVSIRARRRRGGTRIQYRVVDEYPEDHTFRCTPRSSAKPLTLGAILELIWNLGTEDGDYPEGFLRGCLRMNAEGGTDTESMTNFISVESLIYPELDRLAGEKLAEWVRCTWPEEDGEEDDEESEDAA
jgi:hypothetical protein